MYNKILRRTLSCLPCVLLYLFFSVKAQPPIQMFWALNKCPLLLGTTPRATVAYSLRKLSCAYTGPVINVRRSSNNAEGDVYFDTAGGISGNSPIKITVRGSGTSLTVGQVMLFGTFYNGTDVSVTTWYDQSGNNRHAIQSRMNNQPEIVSNGALITSNGKASILFSSSSKTILEASVSPGDLFTNGYIGTVATVLVASAVSNTAAFGYARNYPQGGWFMDDIARNISFRCTNTAGSGLVSTSYNNNSNEDQLRTYGLVANSTAPYQNIYISGESVATGNTPLGPTPTMINASTPLTFQIGGLSDLNSNSYHNERISEIVVFNQVFNSSKIADINLNQKRYYGTP